MIDEKAKLQATHEVSGVRDFKDVDNTLLRNITTTAIRLYEAAKQEQPLRPIQHYHEDMHDVLWWRFPVEEPPYCGTPNDSDWPGYHTHFTHITVPPNPPECSHDKPAKEAP